MDIATVCSKELFLFSQIFAVAGDDALGVEHNDVLYLCTERYVEFCTADSSCTSTIYDNLHIGNVLASYLKSVLQACCRDDSSAMLVIVHYRDIESSFQALLDVETLRRLDVLQVDSTECRSYFLYGFAELFWVFLIDFYIEDIHTAVNLEKQSLTFHHWLSAHGTDVAKSEHCCTITDNSNQVTLVSILVCIVWVLLDLKTWECHTRRVSKAQIRLCVIRFCWLNLNLARTASLVIT